MGLKKYSMIDREIDTFLEEVKAKELYYGQKAKLIPTYKLGDEMALTSAFLASIRLVKEFRKTILSDINFTNSGKIHVFTEFTFPEEKKRVDGLIISERGGKIIDAALLEMKNGKSELEEQQILGYLDIAEKYSIPKLITVSNQFVSNPTQSPLTSIKPRKNVSTFHLSWSYILTIAYVLLTDNDTNIEDPDQVEIMQEVVDYFEHPKSGVLGFTEMKDGWGNVAERLRKKEKLKKDDNDVIEAVESWLQEEKDMALTLSKQLGILIQSGVPKFKNDLRGRIDEDAKKLITDGKLNSMLKIAGAASSISITADFYNKSIEYKSTLAAPQDSKTLKGQVGWLRKQIKRMDDKNDPGFSKIRSDIMIELKIKNKQSQRKSIDGLEQFCIDFKNDTIKEFDIILCAELNSKFIQKRKVIEEIESLLSDYYKYVVKHLVKWVRPAPEIKNPVIESND